MYHPLRILSDVYHPLRILSDIRSYFPDSFADCLIVIPLYLFGLLNLIKQNLWSRGEGKNLIPLKIMGSIQNVLKCAFPRTCIVSYCPHWFCISSNITRHARCRRQSFICNYIFEIIASNLNAAMFRAMFWFRDSQLLVNSSKHQVMQLSLKFGNNISLDIADNSVVIKSVGLSSVLKDSKLKIIQNLAYMSRRKQ